MKKLMLTLAISAIASTAHAGGGKISILHCGVDAGDEFMRYKQISVSKRAKGHARHLSGRIHSVDTGEVDEQGAAVFVDYVQAGSDCLLGEDEWRDLEFCGEGQITGAPCGMLDPGEI